MGRPKGYPKSGGKPKGYKDEKTIAWEQIGEYLVQAGSERALKIMMESNNKDFMLHFNNLLEYFKPKQSRVEQKSEVTINEPIIIDWNGNTTDTEAEGSL
jgi:hypothetical protein